MQGVNYFAGEFRSLRLGADLGAESVRAASSYNQLVNHPP